MESDADYSSPTPSGNPGRRNILIVGDVGVGKSSLVNLISGKHLAVTSSGAKSCTLQPQECIVTLDGIEFALYNTTGIHEAQGNMKKAEYLDVIFRLHTLISRLERSGGISLLVFCMKRGRISINMQQIYNLFVEVLCNRQVPVVIVVTHLEMREYMEDWWRENEKALRECGFKPDGHACITTTRGFRNEFMDKYEESREIIRKLLLEHSDPVARKEEKENWVQWVLRWARQLDVDGDAFLKRKLVKRCGFSSEDAELVAQEIQRQRKKFEDAPDEDKSWFDDETLY